jgi:hypothetical protein
MFFIQGGVVEELSAANYQPVKNAGSLPAQDIACNSESKVLSSEKKAISFKNSQDQKAYEVGVNCFASRKALLFLKRDHKWSIADSYLKGMDEKAFARLVKRDAESMENLIENERNQQHLERDRDQDTEKLAKKTPKEDIHRQLNRNRLDIA